MRHVAKGLIALAVAVIVGHAVTAFAASKSVGSGTFGAGTAGLTACQAEPVAASFELSGANAVSAVTLTGVDAGVDACGGKLLRVALTGADGTVLAEHEATIAVSSASTLTVPVGPVPAASATAVAVSIRG